MVSVIGVAIVVVVAVIVVIVGVAAVGGAFLALFASRGSGVAFMCLMMVSTIKLSACSVC